MAGFGLMISGTRKRTILGSVQTGMVLDEFKPSFYYAITETIDYRFRELSNWDVFRLAQNIFCS